MLVAQLGGLVSPELIIWSLIGLLGGFIMVFVVPWVAGHIARGEWPQRIGRRYMDLAMTGFGRAALVVRQNSGVSIVQTTPDAKKEGDEYTLDGEVGHAIDDFGVVGRLTGNRFGIALENRSSYVSPLLSELAERMAREKENGGLDNATVPGDGDTNLRVMLGGFTLDTIPRLADLQQARRITTGSETRRDGDTAKTYTEYSQEGFHERISFGQSLVVLLAMALGFVLVFLGLRYSDGNTAARTVAENQQSLMLLFSAAGIVSTAREWIRDHDRELAALAVPLLVVIGTPVLAFLSQGLAVAIATAAIIITISLATPVAIKLGPGFPLWGWIGPAIGQILVVLAQLATWRGCLVRRDTGAYRYCELRDGSELPAIDEDYYVVDDGDVIPVNGSPGDMVRLGWRPFGVTEEKSQRNLGRFAAAYNDGSKPVTDGGENQSWVPDGYFQTGTERQGYTELLPVPSAGEWTIRGITLYEWARGSSETTLIEQGLQEGLEESGGKQQFGVLVTTAASVIGFLMSGGMAFLIFGGI